jgi:hypothetical protein
VESVKCAVEVPGKISLEDAADLTYRLAFGLPAFGIGPSGGIVNHSDNGDHVECIVEASVASSV